MTQKDLWHPFIHELTGKNMYCNVLTKEKVEFIESYDGSGIEKMKGLHVFQTKDKRNKNYPKRKFWLSVCGQDEFDVTEDELCNTYYRNNVEGTTQWDMPKEVNLLGLCPALEVRNPLLLLFLTPIRGYFNPHLPSSPLYCPFICVLTICL